MTDERWQARIDLAAAYRIADLHGFGEGICNHFTLVVPGTSDHFFLIPYGLHWSEVTASKLIAVSLDGQQIDGEGIAEPTAFNIHAPLHRARLDAKCVLHTHMPYATALTMIDGGQLEMSLQTAVRFYGRIAYDTSYSGVALDPDEGLRLARIMGEKSILFMKHHGVIVVGPTVASAYHDLYYLERACRAQVLAMSSGWKLSLISDALLQKTAHQIQNDQDLAGVHFAALKRLLDRDRPDYAE
jgi:ribulose-5-phosphate 4-epimerase/fuculose-1-phosphate aldolase